MLYEEYICVLYSVCLCIICYIKYIYMMCDKVYLLYKVYMCYIKYICVMKYICVYIMSYLKCIYVYI